MALPCSTSPTLSSHRKLLLTKIPKLQARITSMVFKYVRRGLLEKDKLIVASLVALSILGFRDKPGGRATFESFVSPQTAGEATVYPQEARR